MQSLNTFKLLSGLMFSLFLLLSNPAYSAEVLAMVEHDGALYRVEVENPTQCLRNGGWCDVEYKVFRKTLYTEELIFNEKLSNAFFVRDNANLPNTNNRKQRGIILSGDQPTVFFKNNMIILQGNDGSICTTCKNVMIIRLDVSEFPGEKFVTFTDVPVDLSKQDFQDIIPFLTQKSASKYLNDRKFHTTLHLFSLNSLTTFANIPELWKQNTGVNTPSKLTVNVSRLSANTLSTGEMSWKFSEEFKSIVELVEP